MKKPALAYDKLSLIAYSVPGCQRVEKGELHPINGLMLHNTWFAFTQLVKCSTESFC